MSTKSTMQELAGVAHGYLTSSVRVSVATQGDMAEPACIAVQLFGTGSPWIALLHAEEVKRAPDNFALHDLMLARLEAFEEAMSKLTEPAVADLQASLPADDKDAAA